MSWDRIHNNSMVWTNKNNFSWTHMVTESYLTRSSNLKGKWMFWMKIRLFCLILYLNLNPLFLVPFLKIINSKCSYSSNSNNHKIWWCKKIKQQVKWQMEIILYWIRTWECQQVWTSPNKLTTGVNFYKLFPLKWLYLNS